MVAWPPMGTLQSHAVWMWKKKLTLHLAFVAEALASLNVRMHTSALSASPALTSACSRWEHSARQDRFFNLEKVVVDDNWQFAVSKAFNEAYTSPVIQTLIRDKGMDPMETMRRLSKDFARHALAYNRVNTLTLHSQCAFQ